MHVRNPGDRLSARNAACAGGRPHRGGVEHCRPPDRRPRYRQARADMGARPYVDAVRFRRRRDPAGSCDPRTPCAPAGDGGRRHAHGDGTEHIHVHSHANEEIAHRHSAHTHQHGFRWRTLLVGLMHGMAGSAALLVLTVSQASSVAVGLGYVALFGVGSMIGMGALSTVIAVPLAVSARWLTWANSGLQGAVGIVTIAIGVNTIVATLFA